MVFALGDLQRRPGRQLGLGHVGLGAELLLRGLERHVRAQCRVLGVLALPGFSGATGLTGLTSAEHQFFALDVNLRPAGFNIGQHSSGIGLELFYLRRLLIQAELLGCSIHLLVVGRLCLLGLLLLLFLGRELLARVAHAVEAADAGHQLVLVR